MRKLDDEPTPAGYAQNTKKAAVVLQVRGRRHRKFVEAQLEEATPAARYLGGLHCSSLAAGKEIEIRLRSMDSAWYGMYSYWFAPGPRRVRQLVFAMRVAGAGLAGLESYCLTDTDVQRSNVKLLHDQKRRYGKQFEVPNPISARMLWRWAKLIPVN